MRGEVEGKVFVSILYFYIVLINMTVATVFFAKLVGQFHYQKKFGQWPISWYIFINYVNHKYDTVVTVIIDNDENDKLIDMTDDGKTTNDNSFTAVIHQTCLNYAGASMTLFAYSAILMIVFGDLVTRFIFSFFLLNCYE